MFGFGNKFDKKIVLFVGRKDALVPFLTVGRRTKMPDGSMGYLIRDPSKPKIVYKMDDIPTKYINANGVIEIYTLDYQQFAPCSSALAAKDQIDINTLSSEQKVWYTKSVREDIMRTTKHTWWNENKTMIFTIIVLIALCLIVWIMMTKTVEVANAVGAKIGNLDINMGKLVDFLNSTKVM